MKRSTAIFILVGIAIALFCVAQCPSAHAFKSFAYVFGGKWQPAEDPLLVDQYGFADIQNMRRNGKRLRGVSGHTATTSGIVNATYKYIRNGFHFSKDQPAESHVIVYAEDATNSAARVYQNTTAIPSVGDFSATALHTPATGYGLARFSDGAQGTMLYCNGVESMIWGGDEARTSAFITSTAAVTAAAVTNAKDQTSAIQNTSTAAGYTITIAAGSDDVFLIGSTRPLQGVKLTVSTANTGTPTLTGKEWDGSSWSALSNMTDNTSGLKTTGTITFDSTVSTSKLKYLEGYILFWYQFELDAGTAAISYCTVDAPWQDIQNVWDGTEDIPGSIMYGNASTYVDYTDEGISNDPAYVVVLDAMDTTHTLLLGFTNPQQGFKIRMKATKENATATVMTVKYWTGSAWAAVSNQVDGTIESSTSLYKTGVVTWSAIAAGSEFKYQISEEIPVYYYQVTFSVQLDAEVEAYYITGIPSPESVAGYVFPGIFQERGFLFSEKGGQQNKAIYSAYNSPDVYNGPDTGELYFGDEKALTAAGVIYNLFSTSGIYQLIVTKKHETYRVYGNGPDNWVIQQLSATVGCVAPLSMAVIEIVSGRDARHVLIWQTDTGVVISDGASIQRVSDDIAIYWDAQHSSAIPAGRIDDSVGWYDAELDVYKLLISSGSGQTTHNVELEYSLKYDEWTKLYREKSDGANPLQVGFRVVDTDGNTYSYGATDEGHVYRTENGTTWGGTNIVQFVKTRDMLLDDEQPYFRSTTVRYFRLSFEDKNGASSLDYLLAATGDYLIDEDSDKIITAYGEQVAVTHYCNMTETGGGDAYQHTVFPIDLSDGPFNTQDVMLGPCISHAFKLEADITNLTDGMELTGMGLYFDADATITVDE